MLSLTTSHTLYSKNFLPYFNKLNLRISKKIKAIEEENVKVKNIDEKNTNGKKPFINLDSVDESSDEEEECPVFLDKRNDEFLEAMCIDYGFRSKDRMYGSNFGKIPKDIFHLAMDNFRYEYKELRKSLRNDTYGDMSRQNPPIGPLGKLSYFLGSKLIQFLALIDKKLEDNNIISKLKQSDESIKDKYKEREKLMKLKLSNDAVWDRERKRIAEGNDVESPFLIKVAYFTLCYMLDVLFNNRPLQRFWFLETVARIPYFSYISLLHLYESLGWWRPGAYLRKIHFAEEWNELHHLEIMEALGGDQQWLDRFFAQHAAFFYYWILLLFYFVSPKTAYNFSELIEAHAVDTYGEFVDANEKLLKSLPPPLVALQYYRGNDVYMFDEFQTSNYGNPRRPECRNLYDVFSNIRDDEGEHVKTMKACQDEQIEKDIKKKINQ